MLVDFIETQITEAEDGRRARPRAPAQQRRRRGRPTTASTTWSTASRPPACPSTCGSARRAARPAARPPRSWPPPAPSGVAPGSRIEITRDPARRRTLDGDAAVGDKVSAGDAVDLGLVDNAAPTIGDFVLGPATAFESRAVGGRRPPSRVTQARFGQLPLVGQLMHTVASPPVAYLLFVIGLALIVFELFTAGVGVAGMVGAGCLVLGCYGLAALPTNPVGGRASCCSPCSASPSTCRRACPGCGAASRPSSLRRRVGVLYDGLSLSWITLLVAIVGIALAMIGGMPAMVRTRFSTPTIGREWMVGEVGAAVGRSPPTASSPSATPRGGPAPTGPPRSTPPSRCGSCRSTGSCSRSSRSTAPPRTTANATR